MTAAILRALLSPAAPKPHGRTLAALNVESDLARWLERARVMRRASNGS